jgi:uncharacterized protein (DUF2267 family)
MPTQPILENTIHETMDWIYAVEAACHWEEDNQRKAFTALRAVLHQLRDRLTVEDAAYFSTQLPLVIRGIYFEDWIPNTSNKSQNPDKEDFLKSIREALYPYRDMDVEKMTIGILHVLKGKLPAETFEKIIASIPKGIKELYKK